MSNPWRKWMEISNRMKVINYTLRIGKEKSPRQAVKGGKKKGGGERKEEGEKENKKKQANK